MHTISPETIRVDVVKPNEPRTGMQVGMPNYPVKVTHLPTGVSATVCATYQHLSRQIAMEMVEWALTYEHRLEEANQ